MPVDLWATVGQFQDLPGRPAGAELLDLVPYAILGADACGQVLLANRAGRAALESGMGLRQDASGRLVVEPPDVCRVLRHLLVRAANGEGRCRVPLGVVLVQRETGAPLHLSVFGGATLGWGGIVALLLVSDPARRPEPCVLKALLRDAYGLTPAEAEVALAVAAGEGLPAAAAARGTAPSTARTHLQRVFDKTGTRRQAQLVRLLAQLCG